jgi:AcrR family transcriptional regulator
VTDDSPGGKRRRVPALAPDERRRAIVLATVPLLREHGLQVSTRQIAQAAGVAEGTLFGVFPDKEALIRAALISCFDPEPTLAALWEIDRDADLRERLVTALDILQEGFSRNAALLGALRTQARLHPPSTEDLARMSEFREQLENSRVRLMDAIASLIEPDRRRLRRSPDVAAHLLTMIMMTTTRGFFAGTEAVDSAEIVTLLLDGLLVRDGDEARDGEGDS